MGTLEGELQARLLFDVNLISSSLWVIARPGARIRG